MSEDDKTASVKNGENMYEQLRQMSLDITPDQLALALPSNETIV